jgi:sugar lactone lactonase YvrE
MRLVALVPGAGPRSVAAHAGLDAQSGDHFFMTRSVTVLVTLKFVSEILKINPDGRVSLMATLGVTATGDGEGVLGLATNDNGDVYAAVVDFTPDATDIHGVWQIRRDGSVIERLAGSESIVFPNALTFDRSGKLYVTDSYGGAVWHFGESKPLTPWVQHDLLAPDADDPVGFPLPGANGIAYFPHPTPHLYVANTEKGLIATILIHGDGTAGEVTVLADTGVFGLLGTIDGVAVDIRGDIYGVIPGHAVLGTVPLVRVDARTGTIDSTVTDAAEFPEFDVPLSLAFGVKRDHRTVFVTNGDLPDVAPEGPGETGPGVVQVLVGVPGFSDAGTEVTGLAGVIAASLTVVRAVGSGIETTAYDAGWTAPPEAGATGTVEAQSPSLQTLYLIPLHGISEADSTVPYDRILTELDEARLDDATLNDLAPFPVT